MFVIFGMIHFYIVDATTNLRRCPCGCGIVALFQFQVSLKLNLFLGGTVGLKFSLGNLETWLLSGFFTMNEKDCPQICCRFISQ